jgi:SAM-dependent methyltransferase
MNDGAKDFSLHSGERQVGSSLAEIRYDHLARYQLAVQLIKANRQSQRSILFDLFCGNGYGTHILANVFTHSLCIGVDGSKDAIDLANIHYQLPNTLFVQKFYPVSIPQESVDVVVCFESLEHIEDDKAMLCALLEGLKADGMAIVSVPNESVHSLSRNPHKFHYRHYTEVDFLGLVPPHFAVNQKFGQDVYVFRPDGTNTFTLLEQSAMEPCVDYDGQVSIYVLTRK